MNLFSKTSTIVKSGIAVLAFGIAVVNFSQANNKVASVTTVSDANANLVCISVQNQTCTGKTDDGVEHTVTNAEN